MITSNQIRRTIIMLNVIDSLALKLDIMHCFNVKEATVSNDGNIDIGRLINDNEALKLFEYCKKQLMGI